MIEAEIAPWQERTEILLGQEGLAKLRNSFVAVIGLGGVGAYVAEMLARAGVGKLLILDSDSVSLTNKNRQLLALDSTIGLSKVDVMTSRLKEINPNLAIVGIKEYILGLAEAQEAAAASETTDCAQEAAAASGRSIEEILAPYAASLNYVVDAIDTLSPKLALIKYCVDNHLPLVSSMGSGAKFDATAVRIADISKSYNCPLAYLLRKRLRKVGISKGFKAVFSEELPKREAIIQAEERNKKSQVGTISYLPAIFGCICAQACITELVEI